MSWAELARRLEMSDLNLRRWREGVRPILRHLTALLELAEELGLGHLFTDWTLPCETRGETTAMSVPPGRRNPGRKPATRRRG